MSRVKKIIRLDEDVSGCSNNAAFLVTIAAVRTPSSLGEAQLAHYVPSAGDVCSVFGGAGVEDDVWRPEAAEDNAV